MELPDGLSASFVLVESSRDGFNFIIQFVWPRFLVYLLIVVRIPRSIRCDSGHSLRYGRCGGSLHRITLQQEHSSAVRARGDYYLVCSWY